MTTKKNQYVCNVAGNPTTNSDDDILDPPAVVAPSCKTKPNEDDSDILEMPAVAGPGKEAK